MSPKATAIAPANIAFIKYWGAVDLERAIPVNASISMTLSRCLSRCTVEFLAGARDADRVGLVASDGSSGAAPDAFAARIRKQLDRLRAAAGADGAFRVATTNSFPSAAGLASSASGFAALTLATAAALGPVPGPVALSRMARDSGSGSAARSVLGGFVEWPVGDDERNGHAASIAGREHWNLRDVIAIVETEPKKIPSLVGHERASTSPYYPERQRLLPERTRRVRSAIERRSFEDLAPVVEEEAVDLHLIAMSSRPPIFYWRPGTIAVMDEVRRLRESGVAACFTIDAGANVHVLCPADVESDVAERVARVDGVVDVIRDGVGDGPRLVAEHLF